MLKNRSNIAASILSSPEILEDAYKQSTQAKGFGDTELGYYMDSLEARITKLQNRISEFATLTIDSQWLKDMVGLLTVAMEHVNGLSKAFGGLSVAAGAIGGFFLQQNGFGLLQYNKTTKKTSWGKFITSIQNRNTPQELSPELQNYFSQYDSNQQIEGANLNWQVAPEEFKKYVQSMNEAGKELGTFGDAQQAVATRTTLLSGALKKGTNIAKLFGSTLVSMGVSMLASFAVGKIIEGIQWLFTYHQRTIKAGEEAKNRIKEQTNAYDEQAKAINELGKSLSGQKEDYKSNADAIDVIAKKYSELKEGVNSITNENISLSDEQYQQYLDTCNQLAEQFPSLVSGYDSQKNAILDLGGAADTVTQQLQTLFAAQQLSANMKIAEDLGILFDGVVEKTKELDGQIKELETQEQVYDTYNALPTISEEGIITVGRNKADRITQYLSNSPDYKDWLEIRSDFGDNGQSFLDYSGDISKLTEEERQALQEELMGLFDLSDYEIPQTEQQKQALQMMIEDQWASITSGLGEYLKKAPTFTKLNDDIQAAILANLDNIDLSKAKDYKDFTTFLYTEVLQPLKNLDDEAQKNLSDALQLSADNIPMGDYYDQVKEKLLAAANNDKTKADGWFYQFFSRQFTEDFKNRSILAQAMSKHMKDESGMLPEEAFGWMLGLDRDDLQHAVELFKGQVYTELSELQKDVENYGKNNIKLINDGTLAELLGKEDYKSGAENFEKALSSLTGSLQTLRQNGQLTSEELVNLINTFPQLKDIAGDGIDANDIGNAAFGQLNQWIELIRKNMDGLSDDQKAMAETLIQQMQFQYGDLGLQENQVRQQIHKSVGQIAGLSMYQQFAQAGIATDALEKAGAFTEDNLQITASFIADPTNLEGTAEEVAARWDNYQMLWHIHVDGNEIENEIARLTSQRELNKAESDYRVSLGIKMTAQDYRDDNTLSNQLIEQYEAQIEDATNKINESPLDEELARTQRENINEAQRNIFAERTTQAENNKAIRELMLEPYEQSLTEIEHEMQKTDNMRTQKEATGFIDFTEENNSDINSLERSNDVLNNEIRLLYGQANLLRARLTAEKENYETNQEYTDLQNQIADKEQTRFENNQKIAKLIEENKETPLTKLRNQQGLLTYNTNAAQSDITNVRNLGQKVSAQMYQRAIDAQQEELENLQKQREQIQNDIDAMEKDKSDAELLVLAENNSKYINLKNQLESTDSSIETITENMQQNLIDMGNVKFDGLTEELGRVRREAKALQDELNNPYEQPKASTYAGLIMTSGVEASVLRAQIADKESQLGHGVYKEGTTFYTQLQEEIANLNSELATAIQNQASFIEQLMNMPIDAAQRGIKVYQDKLSDLSESQDLKAALGKRLGFEDYAENIAANQVVFARTQGADVLYRLGEAFTKQLFGENSEQYRSMVEGRAANTSTGRTAQKEIYANMKAQMEIPIHALEDELSNLENEASRLDNSLESLEAHGKAVTADTYAAMQANAQSRIETRQNMIREWQSAIDSGKLGSEDILAYQQNIFDAEDAIHSLTIQQTQWQESINNLPITNIQNRIDDLSTSTDTLKEQMEFRETKGIKATVKDYKNLLKLNNAQTKAIETQNKYLRQQLVGLDKEGSKYREIKGQIDSNKASLRQLSQQAYEYEKTMKNLELTQAQSLLSAINTAMSETGTATGLSISTIEELQTAFSDLEGVDVSALFYNTADGVKLNTDAMRRLIEQENRLKNTALEANIAAKTEEIRKYKQEAGEGIDNSRLRAMNEELLEMMRTRSMYFATYQEQLEALNGHGMIALAGQTENAGDRAGKAKTYLKEAKEMADKGLIGTDDFKARAAYFDAYGFDDYKTFMTNYENLNKYYTDDSSGIVKFWDHLVDVGVAAKSETGEWTLILNDVEKAARKAGMGVEAYKDLMFLTKDYGGEFTFVTSVEDGEQQLEGLNAQLNQAKMRLLDLQRSGADTTLVDKQKGIITDLEKQITGVQTATNEATTATEKASLVNLQNLKNTWDTAKGFYDEAVASDDTAGQAAWAEYLEGLAAEVEGFEVKPNFEFDEAGYQAAIKKEFPGGEAEMIIKGKYEISDTDIENAKAQFEKIPQAELRKIVENSGILDYDLYDLLDIGHADGAWSAGEKELEALADYFGIAHDKCNALIAALIEAGTINPTVDFKANTDEAQANIEKIRELADSVDEEEHNIVINAINGKYSNDEDAQNAVKNRFSQFTPSDLIGIDFQDGTYVQATQQAEQAVEDFAVALGLVSTASELTNEKAQALILTILEIMGYEITPEVNTEQVEQADKEVTELQDKAKQPITQVIKTVYEGAKEGAKSKLQQLGAKIKEQIVIQQQEKEKQQAQYEEQAQPITNGLSELGDALVNAIGEGAGKVVNAIVGDNGGDTTNTPVVSGEVFTSGAPFNPNTNPEYSSQNVTVKYTADTSETDAENESIASTPVEQSVDYTVNAELDTENVDVSGISADGAAVSVPVEINDENATERLNEFKTLANEMTANPLPLTLDNEEFNNRLADSKGKAEEFADDYTAELNANDNATPVVNTAQTNIKSLEGTTVEINAITKGLDQVEKLDGLLRNLPPHVSSRADLDIFVTETRNVQTGTSSGGKQQEFYTGTAITSHADGTAKDWTVGQDETALVNEIGEEGYVHDGVYRHIRGGAQFHHFDKDDIIFNAEQVKQLEKYGRVKSGKKFGTQAHSKGTASDVSFHAYAPGSTGRFSGPVTGSSSGSDSGDAEQVAAAAGAAGDAIEDFKTWLGKLFDWIEVRIERLQSRIALAQAKSENRIGYGKKNADLWEAMEVIRKNLMPDTTAGEARYRQQADAVRSKAIESGLVDEATANDLINKIKLGTIDIQELEENPKQFVDAYKTWFDKAEQLKAQQEELISQVKELEQTRLSNITEQYETLIGLAEEYNSTAEEAANLAIAGTLTDKTTRKAMDLYGQSVARQDAQITPQIAKEIKAYEQELAIAAQIFGTASNEYRSAQTELQAMKTQWIESMNAATETYSKMLDLVSQRAEEQMDLYDKAYAKSSAAQGVAGTGMTGVEKAIEFMGDGTGLSKNKNTYQNQNAMLDLQSKHTEKVMKLREQAVKDLQAEEAKAAKNYRDAMKDSSKSDEERTTMQNRLTLAIKARQEAQKAAAEAEAEYASTLVKNEQEKFSNIENYYETRLAYQQSINKLNEGVETLTNYGNPNGVPDENENMKVMEHRWLTNLGGNNAELKELRSEYSALTNELNRSDLVKGSDEWMELQTRINGVRSSIYDLREENLKLYEEWMNAPTQKAEDKIQKLANDFANVNAAASGISSGGSGIAAALNNISGSISNGTAKVSANKNTYQNQNIIADAQLNQIKQTMKTRQEAEKLAKNNYTIAMANYNKAKKNGASGEDINDFYQKMIIAQNALTTATNNSAQTEGEYIAALVKTEQTKFDNVMKYYDSRIKYQQASNDLAEKELELRNYTSEWMSDKQYETGLNNNLGDLDSYNEELVKLEQQLNSGVNSGVIKKDSEEWKELREKIFGVEQQIKNTREENLKLFEEWSKSPILKADDKIEKLNASFEDMHAAEDAAASGLAGIRAAIDNISGNTRLNANAATWVNQNALLNYDLAETKKTMEYRQGAEKDTLAIYEEQRKEYEKLQKNFNNAKGKLSAEQYQKALSKVTDQQQKMLIAQNNWRDAQKSASEAEGKYAADLIANEQKKFENIVKYYETILNYQKSINSVREKDLDLSNRSAGYMTNSQYSQNIADNSAELKILNAELLRLQNQINNSNLDRDTDEWKELQTQLNNTTSGVQSLREENLSLWESFAKAPIDKAAKNVGKLAQVMNRLKGIYQTISTGISGRQAYTQTLNTVGNKRLAALDNYKTASNYQNAAAKNLESTIDNLQRGRLMGFVQDAINSGKSVNTNSAEFKSLPSSTQAKIKAYNAALSTRNKANASRNAAYNTYNEYNEMYKSLNSGNYASIFKKNSGNPVYTIQNALLDEQLKNQKESIGEYEEAIKTASDNVKTAISRENQAQSKLVNQTIKLLADNRDKFNKDVIDKINAGKKIAPEDIADITDTAVLSAVNNYNTAVDNATDAATNYETALDAQATAAQNYAEAVETTAQMVVSNEKEKFSNVKSYFDNELAYRRALADEVKKGVDLRRAHGYWETQDDFTKQIDEARKELKILQDERKSLQDQLNASVASGAIKKGSEEWKELQTQIEGVDSSILDTKANIENLTQETLRVKYDELFERASQQADRYIDRLQTINGLLNDEMFFTDKGELTAFGALALQEDAKQLDYNIANLKRYIKERQEIMDDYNNGTYGMEKYLELLDTNQSNINQYLNAANSNRQDILRIIKDQAQEELNAINKTIEARKEALSRKKECKKQCSYLSNCWNTLRGLLTTTQG